MKYFFFFIFIASFICANAQPSASQTKDSLTPMQKDSIKFAKILSRATYPLIKSSKWAGVIPVDNITEKPDPTQQYKLLMED